MKYENSLQFAKRMDAKDPLKKFRKQFLFPKHKQKPVLYFTGNSLGLQPVSTQKMVVQELNDWGKLGVEGHFEAKNPWYSYHELLAAPLSKLTGALPEEVVAMNQLTSNLHFLFASFYRPTAKRFKILCEAKAFPSDQYLIQSQLRFHGYEPADALIEVGARDGEYAIREEDILSAIEKHGSELALVFFGSVNYFTGQVFDMKTITAAGHKAGASVGFDLAHAIGNINIQLHSWGVDFAAWCSYKYLNSGPGGVGGAFVHQRHHLSNLPRLAGWWGHDKKTRFHMLKEFSPIPTAEGWQLSNAPVLSMAAHKAALAIFEEAGMNKLIAKSKLLTGYLEFVIEQINEGAVENQKLKIVHKKKLEIITPKNSSVDSGCQLSIIVHGQGKDFVKKLSAKGVVADWREPNVIRVAPVPLYNSFEDVFRFGEILKRLL